MLTSTLTNGGGARWQYDLELNYNLGIDLSGSGISCSTTFKSSPTDATSPSWTCTKTSTGFKLITTNLQSKISGAASTWTNEVFFF